MTRLTRLLTTFLALIVIFCSTFFAQAQPPRSDRDDAPKPYKILTSGKQVTLKCSMEIKNIMVWTADGNRIVEQKDVNTSSYTFRVVNQEKVYFVMVKLANGKVYSEKIGIQ